jgi:hypothetical protein
MYQKYFGQVIYYVLFIVKEMISKRISVKMNLCVPCMVERKHITLNT